MKRLYTYYSLIALVCLSFSCDDYVDIRTEGRLVPEETQNYRYLLNNINVFDLSYGWVDVCSDDVTMKNESQITSLQASTYYRPFLQSYKWADSVYFQGEDDYQMENLYTSIYYANVIIDEVMDSKEGTEQEKLAIKGEALVHRAAAYLTLVNVFGKAYDETTSSTDLGVPLFTTPTVEQEVVRASVKEVYDQIEEDLLAAAETGLSATNSGALIAQPSLASAYALLARTYLYMGNYDDAQSYAESTLSIQDSLVNLADYEFAYSYPIRKNDPELILSKINGTSFAYAPMFLTLSDELVDLFDPNDMRYVVFTEPVSVFSYSAYSEGVGFYRERLNYEGRNSGPTVPEMLLIKAECEARAGQADNAMATINVLRKSRFRDSDYIDMTATDASDALVKVLEERRRELMCKGGFRWFDLKRLNKEPEFAKTITHQLLDVTYTLEPGAGRYQFPFAEVYFQYASGLVQNQ